MKRIREAQQLTILLILLMSIFLTPPVHAPPSLPQHIIIVDSTGNGDFTSIQDAIDQAATADIIQIRPGLYHENTITVNKKITLIGDDTATCIVNCSGNTGFILKSSYVDITHITIINSVEYAIFISAQSTGCNISSCDIIPLRGNGIDAYSSQNTILKCNFYGAEMIGQGIKIQSYFNTIDDCMVQHFSNGVLIIASATDNTITNCNIFDNENGVDIRMNSNNNVITNCNIYSNLQGVRIWQNSNNNSIYLNNIFKNDEDAIDENTNHWDTGEHGNYWDDYRGNDANNDNIGDTPYPISTSNGDRYPIMTFLLPDVVIAPTDIKQITSTSDTTPTFTWDPAIYNQGIRGYYVTIDLSQETFVDTTTWTTPTILTNGVHTVTVRAEGTDGKTSAIVSLKFSIDTSFNDLDHDGWSDEEEKLYGTDPNNPANYPLDTDNDHIPNSVDQDDDNDGYNDSLDISYGTDPQDQNSYPSDFDKDKVPDEDSPDGKYIGDVDDDDDGLVDLVELQLGSDPKNGTDVERIYLNGKPYFLVDTGHAGVYTILFEPTQQKTTGITKEGTTYYMDADGDGSWDFTYNTLDHSISLYNKTLYMPILSLALAAFAVGGAIVVLIYIVRKKKAAPRPSEVEKAPLEIYRPVEREVPAAYGTEIMIDDTITLLLNIQRNVNMYLEKLNQIDKKLKTKTQEQTEIREKEAEGVEAEIDKLLEMKTKNNENTHQ